MITWYSNKKIPYRFHKSDNCYVVYCNGDWVNQPNAMSYLHTIQQTRELYEWIKCDHTLYKCIYTTDRCIIYQTQTSDMRQSYYITADCHTKHMTRAPYCHIVNTHNVTSRGTTKYSYSKWELWIFKWEKQKVIYPSASLPSPEVQPAHMETLAAAISVVCMFPFLSQQHQLQTEVNISAPSPTLQGCSLVCVTMSSLTD